MDNTQSLVDIVKRFVPDVTEGELANLVVAQKTNPNVVDAFIKQRMKPTDAPMDASTRIPAPVNLPTQLKSPWAGTTQEAQNPLNPAANTISQFDPRLQRDAEARFAEMYKNQAGDRALTGGLMGFGSGVTGLQESNQMWDEKNKHLFEMMVLSEERARKAATEGLAAATTQQNMSKQAGEFQKDMAGAQLDQEKNRLELITTGFSAEQQQRLNDPTSVESQMAKMMLIDQLKANKTLTPEIQAKLSGPVSAVEVMAFLEPKALTALKEKLGGRKTEAEIAQTQQTTRGIQADSDIKVGTAKELGVSTSGGNSMPTPAQAERDQESLRMKQQEVETLKSKLSKMKPGSKEYQEVDGAILAIQRDILRDLNKQGQGQSELAKRLRHATINAGGVSLPPLPEVTAGAQSDAQQTAEFNQRARVFDTELAPTLTRIKEILQKTDPGLLTRPIAKIWAGDSRELVNMFNRFNALYPGSLSKAAGPGMAKSIDQGGFTGSIVDNMTGTQVANMLRLIEETAYYDRDYQRRLNDSIEKGDKPGTFASRNKMPDTTPGSKPAPAVPKDWKLKTDKFGNKAYVSPDGKQFIEVK